MNPSRRTFLKSSSTGLLSLTLLDLVSPIEARADEQDCTAQSNDATCDTYTDSDESCAQGTAGQSTADEDEGCGTPSNGGSQSNDDGHCSADSINYDRDQSCAPESMQGSSSGQYSGDEACRSATQGTLDVDNHCGDFTGPDRMNRDSDDDGRDQDKDGKGKPVPPGTPKDYPNN